MPEYILGGPIQKKNINIKKKFKIKQKLYIIIKESKNNKKNNYTIFRE